MCCKVFSLTSCVSAADVFTICVDACVALVSVNFSEFLFRSDTGNTAGQVGPTQSAARKKARVAAASDRGPAKASCLMFPAMRSTEHGTRAVCSAPSPWRLKSMLALFLEGQALSRLKMCDRRKQTGMIECSTERCGSARPSCQPQQDWKFRGFGAAYHENTPRHCESVKFSDEQL